MSGDKREIDDLPELPDSAELSGAAPEIPDLPEDAIPDLPDEVTPEEPPKPVPPRPAPAPKALPLESPKPVPAVRPSGDAPEAEPMEFIEELEPLEPEAPAPPSPVSPEPAPAGVPAEPEVPLASAPTVALGPDGRPPLRELDAAPAHLRTAALAVLLGSLLPFLYADTRADEGSVWFSLGAKAVMIVAAWVWCQQVLHNFGPKRSGLFGMLAELKLIPTKAPEPDEKKKRKSATPAKPKTPFPTGLHVLSMVLVVVAFVLSLRDPRISAKAGPVGPAEVGVLGWAAFTVVHIAAYRRWANFNPLFALMYLGMLVVGIASIGAGLGAEGLWKISSIAGGVLVGGGGALASYTIFEAMMQAKKEGDRKKAEAFEARKAARKSRR